MWLYTIMTVFVEPMQFTVANFKFVQYCVLLVFASKFYRMYSVKRDWNLGHERRKSGIKFAKSKMENMSSAGAHLRTRLK
jgi:hypothetical protein